MLFTPVAREEKIYTLIFTGHEESTLAVCFRLVLPPKVKFILFFFCSY